MEQVETMTPDGRARFIDGFAKMQSAILLHTLTDELDATVDHGLAPANIPDPARDLYGLAQQIKQLHDARTEIHNSSTYGKALTQLMINIVEYLDTAKTTNGKQVTISVENGHFRERGSKLPRAYAAWV